MNADTNDTPLVSVYVVHDAGLMPLAGMALDQEKIDYAVRAVGSLAPVALNQADRPVLGADGGSEIFVRPDDADRARALLEELATAPLVEGADLDTVALESSEPLPTPERANIAIYDDATNLVIGRITDTQLSFLDDQLDEESATDRDYFLTAETIDMLEAAGGDAPVIAMLRNALDANGELTISWVAEV